MTTIDDRQFARATAPVAPALVILPARGPGYATYGHPERRFGHPSAVAAIRRVAARWQGLHPDWPPLMIGNISPADGTHSGHRTPGYEGLQIDMRPAGRGSHTGPLRWTAAQYSRERTQELVRMLHEESGVGLRNVLFNDPCLRGVWPYPGHDDHLHLNVQAPGRPVVLDLARTLGTLRWLGPLGGRGGRAFTGADLVWAARYLAVAADARSQPEQERLLWIAVHRWRTCPTTARPCFAASLRTAALRFGEPETSWARLPETPRRSALRVLRGLVPPPTAGAGLQIVRTRRRPW